MIHCPTFQEMANRFAAEHAKIASLPQRAQYKLSNEKLDWLAKVNDASLDLSDPIINQNNRPVPGREPFLLEDHLRLLKSFADFKNQSLARHYDRFFGREKGSR